MENLIKPVAKLNGEELKAIGGFLPDWVRKSMNATPELTYVAWAKGRNPIFFMRLEDGELMIRDGKRVKD